MVNTCCALLCKSGYRSVHSNQNNQQCFNSKRMRSNIKNGYFFSSPNQWCSGAETQGGCGRKYLPNNLTMVSIGALIDLLSFFFSLYLISGTKTLQVSVKIFFGLHLICSKRVERLSYLIHVKKIVIELHPPNAQINRHHCSGGNVFISVQQLILAEKKEY